MPPERTPLSSQVAPSPRKSRALRFARISSPLLVFLTLFGWSLSSPAGSSPDDVFHVSSIWCAYGERDGLCQGTDDPDIKLVPSTIVEMACYAFDSTEDASCQGKSIELPDDELALVSHGNWVAGTYPPLFYATLGVFASSNVAGSVLAIRLFNSALTAIALSITMIALPERLRPVLGVGSLLTLVPLGLFTIASTNPSSWALLSSTILFPATLGMAETKGKRRVALIVIVMGATLLGAGARADAAIYSVVAAGLAWFLSSQWDRWNTFTFLAVATVSILFVSMAGQTEGLGGLGGSDTPRAGLSLIFSNLMDLPSLWLGMYTNLGWLDTAISPLALFALVFAVSGVLFICLAKLDLRKGIALAVTISAVVAIPSYLLFASNAAVGSQVQPRYILPLFVILVSVALTPIPDRIPFSISQIATLAILLGGAHFIAIYDELTRYVSGERVPNLDNGTWWWSSAPLTPMGTFAMTGISFSLLLGALAFWFVQYQRASQRTSSISGTTSAGGPTES